MQDHGTLLNTREIAERLSYSQRQMQEWCRQGTFKTARMIGRQWRVSEREVLAKLEIKNKLSEDPTTPQPISEKIILDITKLAKRLEWLIYTPEPKKELLDYNRMSEKTEEVANRVYNENIFHATLSSLLTLSRTPWWSTDRQRKVDISLSKQQKALLNRFLGLTSSQKFKEALDGWKIKANKYLELVRSSADVDTIKEAYQEANQTETVAHKELWEAVENLRWLGQ
jgi:excisionase family DNA binding protein